MSTNDRLSTGNRILDDLLEGGLPRGVVTHVVGKKAAGKTRLMRGVTESVVMAGGKAVVLDFDHCWQRPMYGLSVLNGQHFLKDLELSFKLAIDADLLVIDCLSTNLPGVYDNLPSVWEGEVHPGFYVSALDKLLLVGLPNILTFLSDEAPQLAVVFLARAQGRFAPGGKAIKDYPHLRLALFSQQDGVRAHILKNVLGNYPRGIEAFVPFEDDGRFSFLPIERGA